MTTPEEISFPSELTTRIGEAIEAYAKVEGMLALLFQRILKIDIQRAYLIIFSIQNSRARNELFSDLLTMEYEGKLNKYWGSCGLFLGKLAQFRNAIAHWQPTLNVFEHEKTREFKFEHIMAQPNLKKTLESIGALEIGPFLVDCWKIRGRLSDLEVLIRERPAVLPEKFQKPIPDQNLAVLQRRQIAKEQSPLRKPSVPKLSVAQKRAKALKDARKKKSS
jgi:hypothetical protein